MTNQCCQTDFVEYTEFTPIVTAIQVKDAKMVTEDYDEECDCDAIDCCCMCIWYLGMGGFALALLYYTGAL